MNKFILSFLFMLVLTMSWASFPVTNDENGIVAESITTPNIISNSFDTLGWIALGCLLLGGISMALQSILAP